MHPLIHLANILILVSFLVRDILWLRLLSISAGVAFILHFTLGTTLQLEPVFWNGIFILLNIVQIVRLIRDRRPVHLSEDARRLYELTFSSLPIRQFAKLTQLGSWHHTSSGNCLCEQNSTLTQLYAIVSGTLTVEVNGKAVARLGPGRLVGEMSFLTGKPTSARVIAEETTTVIAWNTQQLRDCVTHDPELHAGLQSVIGKDLSAKLSTFSR